MKTLFTSEAESLGGRSGSVSSPDGLLNSTLGNPLDAGDEQRGPNPELFFAGAYAACYHGALKNAANKSSLELHESKVRALVSLMEDDQGGYRLKVELHAELPGVPRDQARRLMEAAHLTCPYSKALRGDATVRLVVDDMKAVPVS
jgi:Ohr subfamily peroxiredoxin